MNTSSGARDSSSEGDEPVGQDAPSAHDSSVQVRREGHVVAAADITSSVEPHGKAKVSLHSHRDVVAPGARGELVDAVLDQPGVRNSDSVHVVVPLGDAESISRLQERTTNFDAHAAGASSVIEAEVVPPDTTDS